MRMIFARYQKRFVIVAIMILSLAGCGGPGRQIVGKWSMSGSPETIWEFSANRGALIDKTRGKYTFGSDNRIKIETGFATSVYQMEFIGDRMVLRSPSGSKLEFTKVK